MSTDRDDFELAADHVVVCAEIARAEGALLHEHGFRPMRVVGQVAFLWKRGGAVYTTAAAVEEATPPETITDKRGDPS